MSIMVKHVDRIVNHKLGADTIVVEPVIYVIVDGLEDCASFKMLVQQGSCLEPNISPAMKELADLVTTGAIQQPYREMPK